MKKKSACGLLVVAALVLGGCGATLTELTPEEEEIITQYSAKVVSKHNVRLGQGIMLYEPPEEENTEEEEAEEEETPETASGSTAVSGSTAQQEQQQPEAEQEEQAKKVSMSEAMGIKGLSFNYKGVSAAKDMQSENLYIDEPSTGKKYIVLTFDTKNTTNNDMDVNILTMQTKFTASIGDESVNAKSMPMLAEDLPTYTGTIKANSSQKMVIYFEFSEGKIKDKDSVSLETEVKGNKYRIDL